MEFNSIKENNNENIIDKLNLLLFNIPEDTSLLEKIRWLYVKIGELFSYNYNVLDDESLAKNEVDFSKNYIGRYQTCTQISYILNIIFNNLEGCTSRVIERKINLRGANDLVHLANEVTIDSGEKYTFDLTLDLYLIQSGCQTKQFGYTSDIENTCDIIPLVECERMDRKLGLIKGGEYTDSKITRQKELIMKIDYSKLSSIDKVRSKILLISELLPYFYGYHEGKQFVNKLFNELLNLNYKEYNLRYIRDCRMELLTCFKVYSDDISWYLYDSNLGIIETKAEKLLKMMSNGWVTKSDSLVDDLTNTCKKFKF